MAKKGFFILGVLCTGWCMWSCEKNISYPDIPEIHFKGLNVDIIGGNSAGSIQKTADLAFSFVDGDGDLGVRDEDTRDTLSQIYITWQKKLADGTYENYEFDEGSVIQMFRIPYDDVMNRDEAQNKVLKGTVRITMDAPLNPPDDMDTVRLEFYIMDRALHSSNIDHSPDFSMMDDHVELPVK